MARLLPPLRHPLAATPGRRHPFPLVWDEAALAGVDAIAVVVPTPLYFVATLTTPDADTGTDAVMLALDTDADNAIEVRRATGTGSVSIDMRTAGALVASVAFDPVGLDVFCVIGAVVDFGVSGGRLAGWLDSEENMIEVEGVNVIPPAVLTWLRLGNNFAGTRPSSGTVHSVRIG